MGDATLQRRRNSTEAINPLNEGGHIQSLQSASNSDAASIAGNRQEVALTSSTWRESVRQWLLWLLIGALLIALAYQIPAQHTVHVGYNDGAYVQNFNDPTNRWGVLDPASDATEPLRWSRDYSDLIFPQIGLPATATIRWRALRDEGAPLPTVRVLLNGVDDLGTFTATADWETHTFAITGGISKPSDLFLELRTDLTIADEGAVRGVQVDQATLSTSGWPILPYPFQLLYGSLAIAFSTMLVRHRWQKVSVAVGITLAFLLLYRLQLTGYPLRILPLALVALTGGAVLVRSLPKVLALVHPRYSNWLVVGAGAAIVIFWVIWTLQAAAGHTVLSLPGVERDFGAFAPRAASLLCPGLTQDDLLQAGCVLRADGFYQLGYPFLLWLFSLVASGSAFLAGQMAAALGGALLLAATGVLGWRLLGPGGALLAMLILALSPMVAEYFLYLGTDMPFAAFWALGLAALLVPGKLRGWQAILAGVMCGLAFLVRHPGLLLLPFGWIALTMLHPAPRPNTHSQERIRRWLTVIPWRQCALFTLGWLAAALPQLAVNLADTGKLLYNQQAKNVWLAVYGNTDFSRGNEASNDISLTDVVLADPTRFASNWWRNLQVFAGTGAEDTGEFGQGISLRLLHFPANWLAVIGLGIWLLRGTRRERLLLLASLLYLFSVSIGFLLPRFFLPLTFIWALASATTVLYIVRWLAQHIPRLHLVQWAAIGSAVLVALMLSGPQIGARYVQDRQNPDAASVVKTLLPRLDQESRVLFAVPPNDSLAKYSAIAHYSAPASEAGVSYVVWSPQAGALPQVIMGQSLLATFGRYQIYGAAP